MVESEFTSLDPKLWEKLPGDILERVVSKLSFVNLAIVRAVCKHWRSVIIPRVAREVEASTTTAVLYCGRLKCERLGPAWSLQVFNSSTGYPVSWLEVYGAKNGGTSTRDEFRLPSFPTPKFGEDVRLVASEGGLLFFSFGLEGTEIVREFVVCNPLLGESKCLGLPSSHLLSPVFEQSTVLVGVVINEELGSYTLVAVGVDCSDQFLTLIYESGTSTWKTSRGARKSGSRLYRLLEESEARGYCYLYPRSMCSNGNLYWHATYTTNLDIENCVLKYDLRDHTWSKFQVRDGFECRQETHECNPQIGLFKGEVLLSHIHVLNPYIQAAAGAVRRSFNCKVWRSSSESLQSGKSEIEVVSGDMVDEIDRFLGEAGEFDNKYGDDGDHYFSFGQKNFFYYVQYSLASYPLDECNTPSAGGFLKVLVFNTSDNSYTRLPSMWRESYFEGNWRCASYVWAFSPSLTANP